MCHGWLVQPCRLSWVGTGARAISARWQPRGRTTLNREVKHVLTECAVLLKEYRGSFEEALREGSQQDDPPAIMLRVALNFGQQTIDAMLTLLHATGANASFCLTLVRPFYEASARVLWASRASNGWQQLQAYYAKQDVNWANKAKDIPETAEAARRVIESRDEVLKRLDPDGRPYDPMPARSDVVLKEIEQHDVADGLAEEFRERPDFNYTNVYRLLCRPAHGHLPDMHIGPKKGSEDSGVLRAGTVLATYSIVRAVCAVGTANFPDEVKALNKRLGRIWQNGKKLAAETPEPSRTSK